MANSEGQAPKPAFTQRDPPNTGYTFGQKLENTPEGREWMKGVESGWTSLDPSNETLRKLKGLMMSGVAPRPVGFISSVSSTGVENLAPYSWFNMVSAKPPVVAFGTIQLEGKARDTAIHIKANGQFTVNIVSEPWVQQANACAVECPPDVSEWSLCGLTREPSSVVKPARVRESAFSMECEMLHAIPIYHTGTDEVADTIIIGQVVMIHVRNDTLNARGYCDPGKLRPVSRMGGLDYSTPAEGFILPRYTWPDLKPH